MQIFNTIKGLLAFNIVLLIPDYAIFITIELMYNFLRTKFHVFSRNFEKLCLHLFANIIV